MCIIGPLPLVVSINDLPLSVSSKIRMCAVDCVIYRTITNASDQVTLQRDLRNIQEFCDKWLLTLDTNKCKLVSLICHPNRFHSPHIYVNQNPSHFAYKKENPCHKYHYCRQCQEQYFQWHIASCTNAQKKLYSGTTFCGNAAKAPEQNHAVSLHSWK